MKIGPKKYFMKHAVSDEAAAAAAALDAAGA